MFRKERASRNKKTHTQNRRVGHPDSSQGFTSGPPAVDAKSLALVEAANAIGDEKYRKEAALVAEAAREIQKTLEAVGSKFSKTYSLQVRLAEELAETNGDLNRIFSSIRQRVPEQKVLFVEANKLRSQEQSSSGTMEAHYAAFKGITGINMDYVLPTANTPQP